LNPLIAAARDKSPFEALSSSFAAGASFGPSSARTTATPSWGRLRLAKEIVVWSLTGNSLRLLPSHPSAKWPEKRRQRLASRAHLMQSCNSGREFKMFFLVLAVEESKLTGKRRNSAILA